MFDAHGGEPAPLSSAPVAAPRKIVGKSSRGRKVPTLQQHIAESTVGGSGVVGGRKVKVAKTNGGKRNFVCNIDGCGKCFLRSEHLKRHVRSLHSLEKPHMCPHDGCGKSFSRRDNLAQHCRVHL
ncbi:hypothetical protein DL96DRAFT_1477374 [Flagelloscypha sp. PMI_526]|nr:hypothetical protein DL96DRAFT_1477374 [Flagelloscypha sp. PMI_526]